MGSVLSTCARGNADPAAAPEVLEELREACVSRVLGVEGLLKVRHGLAKGTREELHNFGECFRSTLATIVVRCKNSDSRRKFANA